MNWSGEKETKKQFKKQIFAMLNVFLCLNYSISNPDGDSESAHERRNMQNF